MNGRDREECQPTSIASWCRIDHLNSILSDQKSAHFCYRWSYHAVFAAAVETAVIDDVSTDGERVTLTAAARRLSAVCDNDITLVEYSIRPYSMYLDSGKEFNDGLRR